MLPKVLPFHLDIFLGEDVLAIIFATLLVIEHGGPSRRIFVGAEALHRLLLHDKFEKPRLGLPPTSPFNGVANLHSFFPGDDLFLGAGACPRLLAAAGLDSALRWAVAARRF